MRKEDIPNGWILRGIIGHRPINGGVSSNAEISFSRPGKNLLGNIDLSDYYFRAGLKEDSTRGATPGAPLFSGSVLIGKNDKANVKIPSQYGSFVGYPFVLVQKGKAKAADYVTSMETPDNKWVVEFKQGKNKFTIYNEGKKGTFYYVFFDMTIAVRGGTQ